MVLSISHYISVAYTIFSITQPTYLVTIIHSSNNQCCNLHESLDIFITNDVMVILVLVNITDINNFGIVGFLSPSIMQL